MYIRVDIEDKELEEYILSLTMRVVNFHTKHNHHRSDLLFKGIDMFIDDFDGSDKKI